MSKSEGQREWAEKIVEYAHSINAFVDRGLNGGWDLAGTEPSHPDVEHLAEMALDAVRLANAQGDTNKLREFWPPAHRPFISRLEEQGQSIHVVYLLPDESIVARIGASYAHAYTVHIIGDRVNRLDDIPFFGRSPDRRYFAYGFKSGVSICDGWNGPTVAKCPWPTGTEGVPAEFEVEPLSSSPSPTQLIPFPDGERVLLVSEDGIFVLSPDRASRLLPTEQEMINHFDWLQKEYPGDPLVCSLAMEHGTLSRAGRYIAVGSQDSTHLVFDAELNLVGNIGNVMDYPHHAIFSEDDDVLALNSCHFYNGTTIGVETRLLGDFFTEPYEDNELTPLLEDGSRVYAGIGVGEDFIVGDAYGYIRAFSKQGVFKWQNFIGSSI